MHSHEAHIGEYRRTTEKHILNKIQLWDANSLILKEYFLSSSLKEGMLIKTNKHFRSTVVLWYAQ